MSLNGIIIFNTDIHSFTSQQNTDSTMTKEACAKNPCRVNIWVW